MNGHLCDRRGRTAELQDPLAHLASTWRTWRMTSSFVIRNSSFNRHSDFLIRHSPAAGRGTILAVMKHPPIKRHPSLQPFSRDHYVGLVAARHLGLAAEGEPAAGREALDEFIGLWRQEIAAHLRDEERLLADLIGSDDDLERLRGDHAALRDLAAHAVTQARDDQPDANLLRSLGRLLHDHIRWEERQLFVTIEQSASEQQLGDLARETAAIEATRTRSGQEDELTDSDL